MPLSKNWYRNIYIQIPGSPVSVYVITVFRLTQFFFAEKEELAIAILMVPIRRRTYLKMGKESKSLSRGADVY